jgi:predicted glutamine amidotransferase
MCRFIAIVASEPTAFSLVLNEAPRSLASLSHAHPDGWGIAVHSAAHDAAWTLQKGVERASDCPRFQELAGRSRGRTLIAHVRQKTVGSTRIENTHPFTRDGWVFAHNGTITDDGYLRSRCSKERLSEVNGDTDSELFFAHVLTHFDEHGLLRLDDERAKDEATTLLRTMTSAMRAHGVGAFNFLLSDGQTSFAHRFGRSLFVLERGPGHPVKKSRHVTERTSVVTRWSPSRRAVFLASERITEEPWREVPEGSLLRVDREPAPHLRVVDEVSAAAE